MLQNGEEWNPSPKTKGDSKASEIKGTYNKGGKSGQKVAVQSRSRASQLVLKATNSAVAQEANSTIPERPSHRTLSAKHPQKGAPTELACCGHTLPSLPSGESRRKHYIHPLVQLFYTSSHYIGLQRRKKKILSPFRRYVTWDGHRVTNVSGLKKKQYFKKKKGISTSLVPLSWMFDRPL